MANLDFQSNFPLNVFPLVASFLKIQDFVVLRKSYSKIKKHEDKISDLLFYPHSVDVSGGTNEHRGQYSRRDIDDATSSVLVSLTSKRKQWKIEKDDFVGFSKIVFEGSGDWIMELIGKNSKTLESIDWLCYTTSLSKVQYEIFLPKLKRLCLRYWDFAAFQFVSCPSIEVLEVEWSDRRKVDEQDQIFLMKHCHLIQTLKISDSWVHSNGSDIQNIHPLKNLKELIITCHMFMYSDLFSSFVEIRKMNLTMSQLDYQCLNKSIKFKIPEEQIPDKIYVEYLFKDTKMKLAAAEDSFSNLESEGQDDGESSFQSEEAAVFANLKEPLNILQQNTKLSSVKFQTTQDDDDHDARLVCKDGCIFQISDDDGYPSEEDSINFFLPADFDLPSDFDF